MENPWEQIYSRWMTCNTLSEQMREELEKIKNSPEEIKERFSECLSFGTGGMRGIMGAGTNRINLYTIRRASQGVAQYLLKKVPECTTKGVAIAYDSRLMSKEFAQASAAVFASYAIPVWIYPRLEPTPALSFAVRHFKCSAGIMITASHNPAQYNGYKVYGDDGGQITSHLAEQIFHYIQASDDYLEEPFMTYLRGLNSGIIREIPQPVLDQYLRCIKMQSVFDGSAIPLKIVYTPLNGSGRECVIKALSDNKKWDVIVVPEQEMPDGCFATCPYPNPEIEDAYKYGIELCRRIHPGPDVLLATDPDCDRLGAVILDGNAFRKLSGNEIGILLFDYICKIRLAKGTMPQNPVAVTTIVSSDMAEKIALKYGVELRHTLTGFKYIGEQITHLERVGEADRFVFGFEESHGYLTGGYVRDKDGVAAALLFCEMMSFYKAEGMTLSDMLTRLYSEHGYYINDLINIEVHEKAALIMSSLREHPVKQIGMRHVLKIVDYLDIQRVGLPKADVLEYQLEHEAKIIIRPSGTEPKLKLYLSVHENTIEKAKAALQEIMAMKTIICGLNLRR